MYIQIKEGGVVVKSGVIKFNYVQNPGIVTYIAHVAFFYGGFNRRL